MKNRKEHFTIKQRRIITALLFVVVLAFFTMLGFMIGKPMIKFVSKPHKFRSWVDSHGIFGRLAFIGMVVFQVVFAVIPGEPLEIGAGYAFGAIEGTILCIIGFLIGGSIVFALVRTLGIKLISVFFSVEKIRSMKFLKNEKRLKTVAFILFFLPGTPKDLLSYFVGITNINWGYWLFLTSVARLPSVITSTVGGDALGVKNYLFAIIVFAVTAILSIIGIMIYKHIANRRNGK